MIAYVTIFSFIALGVGLRRWRCMPDQASDWLNQVAIVLCLPALILLHVPTLKPDLSLLPLILIPWTLLLITVVTILPLTKWLGWSDEVTAVLLVLLPLGNTSFLGFPLVSALLGDEALPLAVVYDQFGSFLMVSTHVLLVVTWFGTGRRPKFSEMANRLVRFPPFLALLVALVFGHQWLGVWGLAVAQWLAFLLLPIVTLAIGLSLQWRLDSGLMRPLMFGVVAKLMVLPMITLVLLLGLKHFWFLSTDVAQVALIEAAMPSMITAAALLARAQLAPMLASAMVAWTVVLSVATVPIWFWISAWLLTGS